MNRQIPLVIHATHEAGVKVGGIGAVLDGLLSASTYNEQVQRTILAGPMMAADPAIAGRLIDPVEGLTICYSSLHGKVDGVSEETRAALQRVEQTFQIAVLYGVRRFGAFAHEVLLVDASNPDQQQVSEFKDHLWQNCGIDCARYRDSNEFNLHIAIAAPLFAAIKALGADNRLARNEKFIIAHEWLGMPLVFASQLAEPGEWRTIFYAHELATARNLVELHPGHDTRFYNALFKAREWRLNLESVFGNQEHLFKHAIVRQALRCDNILAVGDLVEEELRFLGGGFATTNIDLVYNGIPSASITLPEKQESKRRLQQYAQNLLGYRPDYVFSHVTRLVTSKALWRDLRVLEHLDGMLHNEGKSGVVFMLSSSNSSGRRDEWVTAWEQQYGWPVGHRGDNGDLLNLEWPFFFDGVQPFNRRATNLHVVLVNQFGWSRGRCGLRMPAEMEFADLRQGTDLEFGQSIYEPFGAAQLEPLTYGALCCVSSVCGCVGFLSRVAGVTDKLPNTIVADYCTLPAGYWLGSPYDALAIDQGVRDWIEGSNSLYTAHAIHQRLPRSEADTQALLDSGYGAAQQMSWEVVARDYFLLGLRRAVNR